MAIFKWNLDKQVLRAVTSSGSTRYLTQKSLFMLGMKRKLIQRQYTSGTKAELAARAEPAFLITRPCRHEIPAAVSSACRKLKPGLYQRRG